MNKIEKKKQELSKKLFWLCTVIGTSIIILLFAVNICAYKLTGYDTQLYLIALSILIMGMIARVSYSTSKYKNVYKCFLVGVVAFLLFITIITGTIAYRNYELQERMEDTRRYVDAEFEYLQYEWEMEERAIYIYDNNFTKDEKIMSALYTIRSIYPFLDKQMPILRDKMAVLVDNVTLTNYAGARDQYLFCAEMNAPYSENYTTYFNIFNEKYKRPFRWIFPTVLPVPDIARWDEEYMFAIESDYDSDHNDGFEVEWYSDELEYIESQLDFISGCNL